MKLQILKHQTKSFSIFPSTLICDLLDFLSEIFHIRRCTFVLALLITVCLVDCYRHSQVCNVTKVDKDYPLCKLHVEFNPNTENEYFKDKMLFILERTKKCVMNLTEFAQTNSFLMVMDFEAVCDSELCHSRWRRGSYLNTNPQNNCESNYEAV